MHSDRPDQSDLQVPWLASLPLEPGYQDAALVIVHQGRAATPAEGLAQVLRFQADGKGNWIAAARALAGRWGYIDSEARWRVPPVLQKAFSFSGDGLARFCQDGRWGFLDLAGQIALAPTFDNAQPFRHGVCAVQVGKGAWRILDRHGQPQCSEDFRELGAFGANALARATPQTETGNAPLHGFVDTTGQWVVPPRFRSVRPFGEWPVAAASLDGVHHGLIDAQGRWVLAPRYATLDEFNADGLAFFAEDGAWDSGYGYVDVHGRVVVQGGRFLSRHMACGVAASSAHGRAFVCADGQPLPAPVLSFGTDFSAQRGFAVARAAAQSAPGAAGEQAPALPDWGLLHPDGRWVPAPAQLLEPLTDGDGWLVAPQPDTPLVPFITRDGQMAFVNGEGAVVWRAHYDGQQVALLDAQGALLWRSEARANCWPPRPFFNGPLTDHLEGLQTLDGIVPLAHRLLAEAEARRGAMGPGQRAPAAEACNPPGSALASSAPEVDPPLPPHGDPARRVAYAGLSQSHSGPYAFLPAQMAGAVADLHAELAQRLSARYGAPAALPAGNPALRWHVPPTQPVALRASAEDSSSAPGFLLTLFPRAGNSDGDAWWEVWLAAAPRQDAVPPPAASAPAASPRVLPSPAPAEHSAACVQAPSPAARSAERLQRPPSDRASAAAPDTPSRGSWVRHSLRTWLRRTSIG